MVSHLDGQSHHAPHKKNQNDGTQRIFYTENGNDIGKYNQLLSALKLYSSIYSRTKTIVSKNSQIRFPLDKQLLFDKLVYFLVTFTKEKSVHFFASFYDLKYHLYICLQLFPGMVRLPRRSPKNPLPTTIPTCVNIPEKEEVLSSKAWLRKYNMNYLGLSFVSTVSIGKCNHSQLANRVVDTR